MNERIDKIEREIAAKNEQLLQARIDLATNSNPVARAKVDHFEKEVSQLRESYNTLIAALASAPAQTQAVFTTETKLSLAAYDRYVGRFADKALPSFDLTKMELNSLLSLKNAVQIQCQNRHCDFDKMFPKFQVFYRSTSMDLKKFHHITSDRELQGIVNKNAKILFYFTCSPKMTETVSDHFLNASREVNEVRRLYEKLGYKLPFELLNIFSAESAIEHLIESYPTFRNVVIDEIQRCPTVVNWLISKMSYTETKLRVIFTGTPATGFQEAVILKENSQKIDYKAILPPFTVLETHKILVHLRPHASALDFVKLWSLTGGIVRWMRILLTQSGSEYINDDTRLVQWLQDLRSEITTGMSHEERLCIGKVLKHKRAEIENFPRDLWYTAMNLKRRGTLRSACRDLEYSNQNRSDFYVIDNSMVVSAFSVPAPDESKSFSAKEIIHNVCGLGFENCLVNFFRDVLLHDTRNEPELSFRLDDFEFAGYRPLAVAFGPWDIDCVLMQSITIDSNASKDRFSFASKLVLFSCKVSFPELVDLKKCKNFIQNNVLLFIKNLPYLNELTIVASCIQCDSKTKQKILDIWSKAWDESKHLFAKETLASSFAEEMKAKNEPLPEECKEIFKDDLAVRILSLSLEQILQGAHTQSESIRVNNSGANSWPDVERKYVQSFEFERFKLDGKCVMLGGHRGVGKSTTVRKIFPDALFLEFSE